jgi:putative phosphoribosyl transferase
VLVYGMGSSAQSPRSQYLAKLLRQSGVATLLIDLHTPKEAEFDLHTRQLRFGVAGLLADRVAGVTDWLRHTPATEHLEIGYFGDGTAGAAVLAAAAKRPSLVKAIVSRRGRLDLVGPALTQVNAPTLLIVGSRDIPVIAMNKDAMFLMDQAPEKRLAVVPGASHQFIEPATFERSAALASEWFQRFLHP